MSEPVKGHITYKGLQQQRLVLAALVLGLVAVFVGILLEVYYRGARATQISPAVQRLATPLNPVLNTDVLSQLDTYEQLSLELIKAEFALTPPSIALLAQQAAEAAEADGTASPAAQIDVVEAAVEENTLTEEEILSPDDLNGLLEDTDETEEAVPAQP